MPTTYCQEPTGNNFLLTTLLQTMRDAPNLSLPLRISSPFVSLRHRLPCFTLNVILHEEDPQALDVLLLSGPQLVLFDP